MIFLLKIMSCSIDILEISCFMSTLFDFTGITCNYNVLRKYNVPFDVSIWFCCVHVLVLKPYFFYVCIVI